MRAAPTLTAIGTALWFVTTPSHAIGFGRISNTTQLGQPLNFTAALRLEPDEVLTRECVSAEVQSGENKLGSGQVRVSLDESTGSNERRVRVTTLLPIDEPVVTVTVTVGCTSSVTRKFVAFVDPPLINAPQTAQVETPPEQRPEAQTAPVVAMPQGDAARQVPQRSERSAPDRRPRNRPQAQAGTTLAPRAAPPVAVTPQAPRTPRAANTSRQPSVARTAPPGPRLQLESAPVVAPRASAPVTAGAAEAALAASAASAARVDDAAAQLARERQRIQLLEDGLAKLRIDAQATQAALAVVQARLKQSESERYANPLVYALAWLSALLALAVAGLWWRQSRSGRSAQWWTAPTLEPVAPATPAAAAVAPVAAAVGVLPRAQVTGSHATVADAFEVSTVIDEDDPPTLASPPTRPMLVVASGGAPAPDELPRELSVEELIDLEQQAEFFIVLGQDEAAIDLLMSHVRSDGGISPLPYLKLLEIYRRRGEEEAYQRIRERFNRRFNAYAPDWDADLQLGRSLPDYPDTIARLQDLWSTPTRVMETLDASLFRRNNSDETFDLPAYRELLFLYSVARDLAEHAGSQPHSAVDLLLPLGNDDDSKVSRLMATRVMPTFDHSEMATMPLDLDVSFEVGAADYDGASRVPAARVVPTPVAPGRAADSRRLEFDLDLPSLKPPNPEGR